jgi:hypothetical protein
MKPVFVGCEKTQPTELPPGIFDPSHFDEFELSKLDPTQFSRFRPNFPTLGAIL